MQKRTATLAKLFFHPLNVTNVHSDRLPTAKVVHLMSSDDATATPVMMNPYENGWTDAEILEGVRNAPNMSYVITVHDVFLDKAHMHPVPVQTLDHWHLHFIETPIFADLRFKEEKFTFPALQPPSGKDAWTTTRISIDSHLFHVFVSFAPLNNTQYFSQNSALTDDWVMLYVQAPMLPQTFEAFQALARKSSDASRSLALHTALHHAASDVYGLAYCEHAEKGAPLPAVAAAAHLTPEQLADENVTFVLHGQSIGDTASADNKRVVLCGSTWSHLPEDTAGQRVLPLVLQQVRFLLPLLSDDDHIVYDIIQPHPLAYLFQIRTLGGWTLFGAVNMYLTIDALQQQFVLRELMADWIPSDIASTRVPFAVPITSRANMDMQTKMKHTALIVDFEFKAVCASDVAKRATAGIAPFETNTPGTYDFNINLPLTSKQRAELPQAQWLYTLANVGLRVLQKRLKFEKRSALSNDDNEPWNQHSANLYGKKSMEVMGNTFIDCFLATHDPRPTDNNNNNNKRLLDTYYTANRKQLALLNDATNGTWVVTVLNLALVSLVQAILKPHLIGPSDKNKRGQVKTFMTDYVPRVPDVDKCTENRLSLPTITTMHIALSLRACRGLLPYHWGEHLLHCIQPGTDPISAEKFIQALWVSPNRFGGLLEPTLRALLPAAMWPSTTTTMGTMLQGMVRSGVEMDEHLKMGYTKGYWLSKPHTATFRAGRRAALRPDISLPFSLALAYMLLTNDMDTFNTATWTA